MSSTRKTYFLSPSWNISPEEVQLGGVIANISTPQRHINKTSLYHLIDTPIRAQNDPMSGSITKSTEWTAGLFATFLQAITFGGDVSHSRYSHNETQYSCEVMETKEFTPSTSYLESVAVERDVQNYLEICGIGATIFIITGLKIARSITITTIDEVRNDTKVTLGIDVPVAEINIGPKITSSINKGASHTAHIEGPVVFAFQVSKVRVGWKGDVRAKDYTRGAVLGLEDTDEYGVFLDDNAMEDAELARRNLVKRSGRDEQTGDECDIIYHDESSRF